MNERISWQSTTFAKPRVATKTEPGFQCYSQHTSSAATGGTSARFVFLKYLSIHRPPIRTPTLIFLLYTSDIHYHTPLTAVVSCRGRSASTR